MMSDEVLTGQDLWGDGTSAPQPLRQPAEPNVSWTDEACTLLYIVLAPEWVIIRAKDLPSVL